jgi:hypothetical protein
MGGWWRIIDYKTGTADSKHVKVKDWDDLASNPDLNIGFQLLLYCYLVGKQEGSPELTGAGIFSMKRVSAGFTSVFVPDESSGKLTQWLDKTTSDRFESVLSGILAELYDQAKPFVQTADPDICSRCPYINLCCR